MNVASELLKVAKQVLAAGDVPLAAYYKAEGWHMDDDSQVTSIGIEFSMTQPGPDGAASLVADAKYSYWADHKMIGKGDQDKWEKTEKTPVNANDRKALMSIMESVAALFASRAGMQYSSNNWVMPGKTTRLNERGYKLQSVLRQTLR